MLKTFLRVLFSCILSLFLAIMALGVGLCHYGHSVVCNPSTLQEVAINSKYPQQLYEEIVYDWENFLAITGVETPEQIMVVLTQEQVTQDTLRYLADSYTGTAAINTDALRSNLEEKVRQYAYSHNIYETPEEELEENIQDLVDACISDYQSAISIPMLTKILSTIQRYGNILPACVIGLGLGCIVMLVFIFLLQKKKQDLLYYTTLSAATGSIILLAIPKAAVHFDILNRLPFTESALKSLVKGYLEAIINEIHRYGMIFLLTTCVVLGLYVVITVTVAVISHRKSQRSAKPAMQVEETN